MQQRLLVRGRGPRLAAAAAAAGLGLGGRARGGRRRGRRRGGARGALAAGGGEGRRARAVAARVLGRGLEPELADAGRASAILPKARCGGRSARAAGRRRAARRPRRRARRSRRARSGATRRGSTSRPASWWRRVRSPTSSVRTTSTRFGVAARGQRANVPGVRGERGRSRARARSPRRGCGTPPSCSAVQPSRFCASFGAPRARAAASPSR